LVDIVQNPLSTDVLIENGIATDTFYSWIDQVTRAIQPPLLGSGNPEGAIPSHVGRWYVDQDTVGTGIYLKETGDGDTGWVLRS
jgi:hypothetical protein